MYSHSLLKFKVNCQYVHQTQNYLLACMQACVCICLYASLCVSMCVSMYMCKHVCMHVCKYTFNSRGTVEILEDVFTLLSSINKRVFGAH